MSADGETKPRTTGLLAVVEEACVTCLGDAACEIPKSHSTRRGYGKRKTRQRKQEIRTCAAEQRSISCQKDFSVTAMALLVSVALGPATWQPRSGPRIRAQPPQRSLTGKTPRSRR